MKKQTVLITPKKVYLSNPKRALKITSLNKFRIKLKMKMKVFICKKTNNLFHESVEI